MLTESEHFPALRLSTFSAHFWPCQNYRQRDYEQRVIHQAYSSLQAVSAVQVASQTMHYAHAKTRFQQVGRVRGAQL